MIMARVDRDPQEWGARETGLDAGAGAADLKPGRRVDREDMKECHVRNDQKALILL